MDQRIVRAHGFVQGRVQGVWFRESTRQCAAELGLGGWVRNLPDGRVEAEFVGPLEAVKSARAFVEQGPLHARVDRIEGFEIDELPEQTSSQEREFRIR
ncbi:MAG: acylphosphatase [Deltaproteobacteria bacterium]|nr:acylphosphatase [Deltaproteobacteria bacterium]MBW2387518.1 acylphosphatase [Deltaproteobacteria bacterium]